VRPSLTRTHGVCDTLLSMRPKKTDEGRAAGPRGGKTTVTKAGLIRTVVYLHPDERRALRFASAERELPASEIVREAIRLLLKIKD
jgi:hypothetical protein